jgi:hypothetical protein
MIPKKLLITYHDHGNYTSNFQIVWNKQSNFKQVS